MCIGVFLHRSKFPFEYHCEEIYEMFQTCLSVYLKHTIIDVNSMKEENLS